LTLLKVVINLSGGLAHYFHALQRAREKDFINSFVKSVKRVGFVGAIYKEHNLEMKRTKQVFQSVSGLMSSADSPTKLEGIC
jgi:type IV secretory pathway TrbL component